MPAGSEALMLLYIAVFTLVKINCFTSPVKAPSLRDMKTIFACKSELSEAVLFE